MITLCHTRLQTPHDRLRVSSLKELAMHDGVAFTATLRLDGERVGVIENNGHGGGPLYLPDPGSSFRYGELNTFAAACRRDNDSVSTEAVLNDLVTEYDLTLRITRAAATGATLLRLVTADGYTTQIATVRPAPTTAAQRQRAAAEVAKPDDDGHWQMWTGQAWEPLTDATGSNCQPAVAPTPAETDNDREHVRCGRGDASPDERRSAREAPVSRGPSSPRERTT